MAAFNSTWTSGTSGWVNASTSTSSMTVPSIAWIYRATPAGTYTLADCEEEWYGGMMSKKLVPGVTYDLPDGAKLKLEVDGNYRIEDKDAKVTYKANRIREFSPYLNASDMLAKFVEYVATLGVKRDEVLNLPINLFISWLIVEAAQHDSDPLPPDVIPVAANPRLKAVLKPKCLKCGRFIPRLHHSRQFPFCNMEHGMAHVEALRPKRIELATS